MNHSRDMIFAQPRPRQLPQWQQQQQQQQEQQEQQIQMQHQSTCRRIIKFIPMLILQAAWLSLLAAIARLVWLIFVGQDGYNTMASTPYKSCHTGGVVNPGNLRLECWPLESCGMLCGFICFWVAVGGRRR
ncbi:hypothetical protein F4810DRAFT_406383 [Camillea tinctor]|nr:hypothetical protein F4810DRAFT_406383 [Camillea tinctor]